MNGNHKYPTVKAAGIRGHTTEKRKLYVKEYFYMLLRNKNTEKTILPVFLLGFS